MARTTTTTTTSFAPQITQFANQNLDYLNFLTSGVMNRYAGGPNSGYPQTPPTDGGAGGFGGGFAPQPGQPGQPGSWGPPPQTFVADFSPDTQAAHTMARNFAAGSTPTDIRNLSGAIGGYRTSAAVGLDPNADMNKAVNAGVGTMGGIAARPAPTFAPYSELGAQGVAAQNYQAAQIDAVPGFSAAQVAAVNDIAARRGADMMDAYLNPYMQQVVDTSLADYDVGVDRQANQSRARRDASSAFGDRAALADAVYAADSNRGRGSLASNLRSTAFNTAAGYGMQDSDRFLDADRTNQSVALQRAMENARLQQAAAEANTQMEFNRRQFNTQLDQGTREGNARFAQDANFKNADITNQFKLTNDQRLRDLEMQNFNAGLSNDELRLRAAQAQAGTAQSQQLNQANIAQILAGMTQDQAGLLTSADDAEQRRIAAQSGVGAEIDERNQAILDEPFKYLQMRSDILSQTPMETTTTQVTKKKKGLLGKIQTGLGIARMLGVPIPF